ncbi:MAG: GH36-type glycosyl hydrolase domain-containing protein, partial [Gemmatimonadota bacterium]
MSEVVTKAHVLSNGEYAVLTSAGGGGYSALRGFALTRWQPDPAADTQGMYLYIRDVDTGAYWSLASGSSCGVRVLTDGVEQGCEHDGIAAQVMRRVADDRNAEIRAIRIVNRSGRTRRIDITTYTELSLDTPAADAAHPAFSKLFVQTAFDTARGALIAWRRLRSPDDRPLWVSQRLTGAREYESDRAKFIGRIRSTANPLAMAMDATLSGTVGAVLDPIFSLRAPFELNANGAIDLEWFQCAADTREDLERILDAAPTAKYATCTDPAALGLPARWASGVAFDLRVHDWRGEGARVREATAAARTEYGKFSEDGCEYIMEIGPDLQPTPQPWINVIANEDFGFLVSESGAGYTWAMNSRENRLTPWSNDPVTDPHTETLLVRDNDSNDLWSALPGPLPAKARYQAQHGFGYSRFRHSSHGLAQQVLLYVPRQDSVKITRVRVTNESSQARNLSLTSCAQLVLGGNPADTRGSVVTSHEDGVIFATNAERGEYSQRVAFAFPVCADAQLDHRFGRGRDPCAALQLSVTLAPGATLDCAFLLGEAADAVAARACIQRYRSLADIDAAFEGVRRFWQDLLTRVSVRTPSRALDVMLNGWLAYQNLACRMWARSALYQSGGAFGFRDQLQDSSALLYLDPALTREQILLHAAHQFVAGDVLHWWHPPTSKGIRTRFSDDLLWLPHITLFYIARTEDRAILDEEARFLSAPLLPEGEDEIFVRPVTAAET